jgi:prophage antirepressor-like protein
MEIVGEFKFCNRYIPIYRSVEEPLFLAVDVARAIDYSVGNTAHMLDQVDSDEKVFTRTITTSKRGGKSRPAWFLTEDGVYEVLFQSRKPIAKTFKRIVKDILRDIRRKHDDSFDWLLEWESSRHYPDPETGELRLVDIFGDFIEEDEEE